jgi:uncharacterized repeat protein (TIGR02543 family)
VQLHAVPNPGYAFAGWSGDLVSPNPTELVIMDEDKDITATFESQE